MQASHDRANLMKLPVELRNRIYELVLVADAGIKRPDGSYMIEIGSPYDESKWSFEEMGWDPRYWSTPCWCQQPPLTRISRQLRAAALVVYYGLSTFIVYVEGCEPRLNLGEARPWVSSLPTASQRLIKDLHVRFCPNSSQTGLPGKRMASVLGALNFDVPEKAVTVWVAPEIAATYRGHFEDWQLLEDAKNSAEECQHSEVEEGFSAEVRYAARQSEEDVPYQWS